jgi:hypothetical protein
MVNVDMHKYMIHIGVALKVAVLIQPTLQQTHHLPNKPKLQELAMESVKVVFHMVVIQI